MTATQLAVLRQADDLVGTRAGDLADTFEEFAPAVAYFFSRRGFEPEDCRDLTQETFLRAYRGMANFRADANLNTWLLRIAANVWKNALRDRTALKREAAEVLLELDVDSADEPALEAYLEAVETPLERVLAAERHEQLREAINELPPRMRHCLLLRLDRGLRYREIASVLQVSVDTVKTQLHQARQRLADEVSRDLEPSEKK